MNKGTEKLQVAFRYAFGLLSPVIISLAMVYAALAFYNYQQKQDRDKKIQILEEQAELTMSTVMSNLTFADQFTSYGNRMSKGVENHDPASFSVELLSRAISEHFPDGFIPKGSKAWAFKLENNQAKALTGSSFENSRLRIMEKITDNLLDFSNKTDLSISQINQKEKFVRTVLGPYSAPLQLGRCREGRLTPIVFEGKACYI